MRIAIVGGGATAVSLLYQLIKQLSKISQLMKYKLNPIEIFVIEKQNNIGPGLAYGTPDISHIINLPATLMSPIPQEPSHFYNWALNNKPTWQKAFPDINIENCDYPPRFLYGVYLKEVSLSLIEKAKQANIKISLLTNCEAENITRENDSQFKIVFSSKDASTLIVDKVILSVGHLDSSQYVEFINNPFYFHSIWPTEKFKSIQSSASIFVAGTRLTAIDAVLSLKAQGHTGKIILGSRLGFLPTVIGNINFNYNKQFLTCEKILELTGYGTKKLKLEQVLDLFIAEIESGSNTVFDLEAALHPKVFNDEFLEKEIREVKEGKTRHWQNVLFALYPNISIIWNALSYKSKRKFLDKYYSAWMTYLAAFPLENAEKILLLLKKNELEVLGEMEKVSYDIDSKKFNIIFNHKTVSCDYFINATGAGHNVRKFSSILIQNMLKSQLLIPYNLGGVKVDFKTLQIISNGIVPGLFGMGDSLTYGMCLATADLGQFTKQAIRISNTIEKQLKNHLKKSACLSKTKTKKIIASTSHSSMS